MKTNLIVALLVIAISSLACWVNPWDLPDPRDLLPKSPPHPSRISGTIKIQGEGQWKMCAGNPFGVPISCTGKTSISSVVNKKQSEASNFTLTFT